MTILTVGDMAQSLLLSRRNATLKDAVQNLSTEATTGLSTEITARVKGDYAPLTGIETTLSQISSYKSVTTETALLANHMQLSLNSIAESATALSTGLLGAATSNSPSRVATVGFDANQRLQAAMSALNARVGDRNLFSGQLTDTSAVTDAETMLAELDTVLSTAISADEVQSALDDWFADPGGFAAATYTGGDALAPVPIGADEQAQLDVTAKDPAIIDMIKGLTMAALLHRGILSGSDVARADLAQRAGESLASSQTGFAALTAHLGTVEANIVNAGVRNDAEKSALETARLGILSVDPYETAAKLQEAQTQLETLYSITARMSRLSLVNYL
jgi:flagellar hook-associated protein 3 FlgL